MTATSRSRVVELSKHSSAQVTTFYVLVLACTATLFLFVATPLLDLFFTGFLRSDVIRDGTTVNYRVAENRAPELVKTGSLSTWALADPRLATSSRPTAEYIFKPLIALFPLVAVGGTILAALLTVLLPGSAGFLRQKIQREILVVLDKLALHQYGEHTAEELKVLMREITHADARTLHDLADRFGVPYGDLELLQKALIWERATGLDKVLKSHDAVKFYMREYFTERYANVILGMVYMGAAVLIIVIGIRGLKFLPATDPTVVLGALGLEFMLLITYATILMYGKTEEATTAHLPHAHGTHGALDTNADTEQLVRALMALPRSSKEGA